MMTISNLFNRLQFTIVLGASLVSACGTSVRHVSNTSTLSPEGKCLLPPTAKLRPNGILVAEVYLDKVAAGAINPTKDGIALQAFSGSEALVDYFLCQAVSRGSVTTQEEMTYLKSTLMFLAANPTSEEFGSWQISHKHSGNQSLKVSTREIKLSESNPRGELVVFNTGDVPLNLKLNLPGIFYSPYQKTYLAPHDKVFMTIILTRHTKESVSSSIGEYDATLIPEGLPPVRFKILVTP